jgi:hypothetical protein
MLRFPDVAVTTAPRSGFPSSVLTTPLMDAAEFETSLAEVNRGEKKADIRNKEMLNRAQDFFRIVSP